MMIDKTDSLSSINPVLYGFIGLLAYVLLTCTVIRQEYIHWVNRQPVQNAKEWPPAAGQVGEFACAPVRIPLGKGAGYDEYKVRVRYKFVVNGVSHFAEQNKFFDYPGHLGAQSFPQWGEPSFLTYLKETETQMAGDYAEGTQHVVRYNPADPADAFIDIKITPDDASDFQRRMIIFGALALGAIIWWVVSTGALKMR